jgi:hypothetical protein
VSSSHGRCLCVGDEGVVNPSILLSAFPGSLLSLLFNSLYFAPCTALLLAHASYSTSQCVPIAVAVVWLLALRTCT